MSHYRLKTTYQTQGCYGSTETHTLYANHNECADLVTFYDEDGEIMFTVEDTINNNLFDAIKRLFIPFKDNGQSLLPLVEQMDADDRKKCGI